MAIDFMRIFKGISFAGLASAPSSPANGDVYYDTTLQKLRCYQNGVWVNLSDTDGSIVLDLGSQSAPSLSFTGDSNTGIYSPGADQVAITTGGTARFSVDNGAVNSTVQILNSAGSASAPSYSFTGNGNMGLYNVSGALNFATAGVQRGSINTSGAWTFGSSGGTQTHTFNGAILNVLGATTAAVDITASGVSQLVQLNLRPTGSGTAEIINRQVGSETRFFTSSGSSGDTVAGAITSAGAWTLGASGGTQTHTINGNLNFSTNGIITVPQTTSQGSRFGSNVLTWASNPFQLQVTQELGALTASQGTIAQYIRSRFGATAAPVTSAQYGLYVETQNTTTTTQNFNNTADGVSTIYAAFSGTSAGTGTISAGQAIVARLITPNAMTYTNLSAIRVRSPNNGGSAVTSLTGLTIADQLSFATNTTNLWVGGTDAASPPSGNWNLYVSGTKVSYLSSGLQVNGGTSDLNNNALVIGTTLLPSGSANQHGVANAFVASSAAVTRTTGFIATNTTTAASFTTGYRAGFFFQNATKGAGSTITRDMAYGGVMPTQGTNNAFLTDNDAFSGNWFINSTTSNPSQLSGIVGLGGTTSTFAVLQVGESNPLTGSNQRALQLNMTATSAALGELIGAFGNVTTAAAAFTVPYRFQFYASNRAKGAGSTITRDISYYTEVPSQGTNNAVIADNVSFTGNWFINSTNTNDSLLSGHLNLAGQKELRLQDTTGGEYVGLRAAGTTTTHTLTMPAAAPAVNKVLMGGSATATNLQWGGATQTFTPAVSPASGAYSGLTYSHRNGFYAQLGDWVYFSLEIEISAVTLNTATGALNITTSLPNARSTADYEAVFTAGVSNFNWATSRTYVFARIVQGTNTIQLFAAGDAISEIQCNADEITGGTFNKKIQISGVYPAA